MQIIEIDNLTCAYNLGNLVKDAYIIVEVE